MSRRGGRVAEGAALEMPCMGNPCAVGSNPTPSANRDGGPSHGPPISPRFPIRVALRLRRSGPCFVPPRLRRAVPVIGVIGVRYTLDVVVLDGEVAVPCNPQSAIAGLNSLSRAGRVE